MIIQEGKILMDQGKLKGISEWPSPNTVKQTRGFLGFGNFYQHFIRHFSNIAKPLNDLLKKGQKFEWTDNCQKLFETLKNQFTEEPVLMMPDHTKPFVPNYESFDLSKTHSLSTQDLVKIFID
jgi:RNase H-like domain found in reverse transcriptase